MVRVEVSFNTTQRPRSRHAAGVWRLAFAFALVACSDNESDDPEVEYGSLFVQVDDSFGSPVPDAVVTTDPNPEEHTTDETGATLFSKIPVGFYLVSAVHDDVGVASDAAEVTEDELTTVRLVLDSPATGGTGGTSARGGTSGTSGRGGTSGAGQGGSATGGSGPVGDFIDVATQVEAMVVDPTRPYLYALDRVNNEFLFVNLETRELEKSIFVGSSPVDLDLDADAAYAYVANFGSTEIAVVDLESQEIARTMFVDTSQGTWNGNPYRIAVTAFNTLVFTSLDQWNDLKLVNASNGGHIAVTGTIYSPDLDATADGTRLFVTESGGDIYRYDVSESGLTLVDSSGDGFSDFSGRALLTPDEQYVFYGEQKFLTSNLKSILGAFAEPILATNEDGSLVVGSSYVFDGTTFAILSMTSVSTDTLALSTDAQTLYLYDIQSSRIYLQDLSDL